MKQLTDGKFIKIWENSSSLDEVIAFTNMRRHAASRRATQLRKQGYVLKKFTQKTSDKYLIAYKILKNYDGVTFEEIATLMGLTRQAVHIAYLRLDRRAAELEEKENKGG